MGKDGLSVRHDEVKIGGATSMPGKIARNYMKRGCLEYSAKLYGGDWSVWLAVLMRRPDEEELLLSKVSNLS